LAIATLLGGGAGVVPLVGALLAAFIVAAGLVAGRSDDADRRERAWELQAVGVAVLAAAWLAGVPLAG
jgi:hypothetical protein